MQEGNITAGYNALNQPTMINTAAFNGNWMFFGFDPLGRCVKRWVGALHNGGVPPANSNPATYFYYDGWNLIQEGPGASSASRTYVHGGRVDELLLSRNVTTGQVAYHHYDARGHAILLTNSSGGIMEQYEYDAFGRPYFHNAAGGSVALSEFGNRFLFNGREYLSDLKLYDYRNRMYQPELGRFMQPDPKHFGAGDYNLYRYCHNDPVNKSDPMGLLSIIIPGFGPGQRDRGGNWSNEKFIREALKRFPDGKVFSRNEMKAAKEAIQAARASGDKTLNIAGYSLGGAAGIKLARDLGKSGIGVDKLVTVDIVRAPGFSGSTLSNPVGVPSNVKEAYNYYQQTGGFHPTNFSGTPVAEGSNVIANQLMQEHHARMPTTALRQYDVDAE
jgi:RHS repeat-associated protein